MTASLLYPDWDWMQATRLELTIEAKYLRQAGHDEELARLTEAAEQRGIGL